MVLVFLYAGLFAVHAAAVLRDNACAAKTPITIKAPPAHVARVGTSDSTIQARSGANTTSRMLSNEVSAAGNRFTPSVSVIEAMAKVSPKPTMIRISESEFENRAPNTQAKGMRIRNESADDPAAGVLGNLRYITNPIAMASTIQQARRSPAKCTRPKEPPTIKATPLL